MGLVQSSLKQTKRFPLTWWSSGLCLKMPRCPAARAVGECSSEDFLWRYWNNCPSFLPICCRAIFRSHVLPFLYCCFWLMPWHFYASLNRCFLLENTLKAFGIRISVHISLCHSWGRTNQSTTLRSFLLEILHTMPGGTACQQFTMPHMPCRQESISALNDLQALKVRTQVVYKVLSLF